MAYNKKKQKGKNKKTKSKPTISCNPLGKCMTQPPSPKRPFSSLTRPPSPTSTLEPPTPKGLSLSRSSSNSSISSSPIRSPRSPTRSSLSPSRSSSIRSSRSPTRSSLFPIRSSSFHPSQSENLGSKRLFENIDVSSLNYEEPDLSNNNESEWTQVSKKKSKNVKSLENKPKKQSNYFLSNQLSPSRIPLNEELENLQYQRLIASSNQVETLVLNPNLKDLMGIEIQIKSNEPPPICKRPIAKAEFGERVEVIANHFKCTKLPTENISSYSFEFEPPITKQNLRWIIKREWESTYIDKHLGGKYITYDGRNQVYTYQSLNFIAKNFTYQHCDENEELKTYKINMALNGSQDNEKSTDMTSLPPSLLSNYLKNQSHKYPQQVMSILNMTLKQDICVGDIENHKHLYPFTKSNNISIGSLRMLKIRALQGYYRTLKLTQQGLALNVDTFFQLIHEKSNILDFLIKLLEYKEDIQHMKKILDYNKSKVLASLKGLTVETNHYINKMSRNHKVVGITEESTRTLTVTLNNEEIISVQNYFQKYYHKQIKYLDLPCLILSSKSKNYMPMELCFIVENQKIKDQKGFEMLGKFNNIMFGSTRIQTISSFMQELYSKRNDHPKSFNLEFDVKPTTTTARILPSPMLDRNSETCDNLYHWGVINLSKIFTDNHVWPFMTELISELRRMNLKVLKYQYINGALLKPYPFELMEMIYKKILDAMSEKDKDHVNLIVVILDGKKKNPYYNEIKYWGDCIKGVPTQIITGDSLLKNNGKLLGVYCQKVSLKINCRLGGLNVQFKGWNQDPIHKKVIRNIKYGEFIAFGADVTHPDSGSKNPSLAAVVGSLDFGCSYFGAKIFQQDPHQEVMTEKLAFAITELLQDFKACNNQRRLPKNILYYRDGVGDSQFEAVLKIELAQIKQGASVAEEGYKPNISFIVAQKRHHTRFFIPQALKWDEGHAATLNQGQINIKPGIVVDNDVCDPQRFDFYLCSHYSIIGTPRPVHYYVLYDDSNFSADDFQNITHYLCHIFQRTVRSVSMPAPAYYAHITASRARQIYFGAKNIQMRRNSLSSNSIASTSSSKARTTTTLRDIMDFPPIHENHRFRMFFI